MQQRGREAGARELHTARAAVVVADDRADEAAVLQRLAQFRVDAREPRARRERLLAGPTQQARDAHHQERGIETLARDVADEEGDAPVGQVEIVVEIAGYLVRRQVDADQREAAAATLRQQRLLDRTREIDLAADALLLDDRPRQLRVVDRERGRRGDEAQDFRIGGIEQAAATAVDHLDRADRPVRGRERHAEDRARDEAGFGIDAHVDALVVLRVEHHLRGILGDRAPDDALADLELEPGDVDRPDADLAFEVGAARLDQEHRGRFGAHVDRRCA